MYIVLNEHTSCIYTWVKHAWQFSFKGKLDIWQKVLSKYSNVISEWAEYNN